ncbi:hypothetical protein B1218_36630, partial [Pseudomonas ogarae]
HRLDTKSPAAKNAGDFRGEGRGERGGKREKKKGEGRKEGEEEGGEGGERGGEEREKGREEEKEEGGPSRGALPRVGCDRVRPEVWRARLRWRPGDQPQLLSRLQGDGALPAKLVGAAQHVGAPVRTEQVERVAYYLGVGQ